MSSFALISTVLVIAVSGKCELMGDHWSAEYWSHVQPNGCCISQPWSGDTDCPNNGYWCAKWECDRISGRWIGLSHSINNPYTCCNAFGPNIVDICPSNKNIWNKRWNSCCTAGSSTGCGETCAKQSCETTPGKVWTPNLDHMEQPYTCCDVETKGPEIYKGCPNTFSGDTTQWKQSWDGCCSKSASAQCGAACAKDQCIAKKLNIPQYTYNPYSVTDVYHSWSWLDLDFNNNPYTCCWPRHMRTFKGDISVHPVRYNHYDYYYNNYGGILILTLILLNGIVCYFAYYKICNKRK